MKTDLKAVIVVLDELLFVKVVVLTMLLYRVKTCSWAKSIGILEFSF